jgi:hypothetical protein
VELVKGPAEVIEEREVRKKGLLGFSIIILLLLLLLLLLLCLSQGVGMTRR